MPDHQFADLKIAALYDAFCGSDERDDFSFYLPRVMSAGSVLDVGCGTGALLHRAREAGHTGRLCGLDPAHGMLAQARRRTDVEWVLGDLSLGRWNREFDLVVMTGHAFQVLVSDEALRTALSSVRRALNARAVAPSPSKVGSSAYTRFGARSRSRSIRSRGSRTCAAFITTRG